MGMYVLPQRESSLESYLRDWMSRNQQEKAVAEERSYRAKENESERSARARERQEMSEAQAENARIASIAEQFRKMPQAQQQQVWPTLPPQVQAAVISPSSYSEDPAETTRRNYAKYTAGTDPAAAPREMKDALLYNFVTGDAIPENVSQTGVRRGETTPEQFTAGTRAGFDLPTPAQAQRLPSQIAADKALAERRLRPSTGQAGRPDVSYIDAQIKSADSQLAKLSAKEHEYIQQYMTASGGVPFTKANVPPDVKTVRAQIDPILRKRNELLAEKNRILGQAARPVAPQADIEYITQDEYDALIEDGETPESIAADGLAVR